MLNGTNTAEHARFTCWGCCDLLPANELEQDANTGAFSCAKCIAVMYGERDFSQPQ
jgi:hypothetical protein